MPKEVILTVVDSDKETPIDKETITQACAHGMWPVSPVWLKQLQEVLPDTLTEDACRPIRIDDTRQVVVLRRPTGIEALQKAREASIQIEKGERPNTIFGCVKNGQHLNVRILEVIRAFIRALTPWIESVAPPAPPVPVPA